MSDDTIIMNQSIDKVLHPRCKECGRRIMVRDLDVQGPAKYDRQRLKIQNNIETKFV